MPLLKTDAPSDSQTTPGKSTPPAANKKTQ